MSSEKLTEAKFMNDVFVSGIAVKFIIINN